MTNANSKYLSDEIILLARILLVVLFLKFGWGKLTDYSGTVGYMIQTGVPSPHLAALIAIAVEFFVSIALILGIFTRPFAVLMGIYTLATAFLAHHYWTMAGAVQYDADIHFYKNVSIMGGFLLLYVTGAGKYSLDALLGGAKFPAVTAAGGGKSA